MYSNWNITRGIINERIGKWTIDWLRKNHEWLSKNKLIKQGHVKSQRVLKQLCVESILLHSIFGSWGPWSPQNHSNSIDGNTGFDSTPLRTSIPSMIGTNESSDQPLNFVDYDSLKIFRASFLTVFILWCHILYCSISFA